MYADNQFKMVALLNQQLELPVLMNALGHIVASLVQQSHASGQMDFLRYADKDGSVHPDICRWPIVVLRAKRSAEISKVRAKVVGSGLLHSDFVTTMIGASAADQLTKTAATREADLVYVGLAVFGPAEVVSAFTRRFSLFKSPVCG